MSTTTSEGGLCGQTIHGFSCVLPKGHNMGYPDIPERHQAAQTSWEVAEFDKLCDALIEAMRKEFAFMDASDASWRKAAIGIVGKMGPRLRAVHLTAPQIGEIKGLLFLTDVPTDGVQLKSTPP